ncbi:MAG: OmpH family outer membrane protein [Bacteroidales bacterium]|nr:OmpH family outer membrane protein [Bacteroidales bacterium]HPD94301.1 OmpH family outer membrane protein [Tenuifilaceae bacterium]HRX30349.1 OmpH family outer membrane protein [Tenuifilaceae bacterium]
MRKLVTLALTAMFFLSGSTLMAQNYKFGHINSQELLKAMPDMDSAQVKVQNYGKTLQDQIEELQVEFNKKYQDYLQKRNTLTPAILEMKEKELTQMQQNVQEFQQKSEQEYQDFQSQVMKPVIDKANNAIKKVAKDNGFTYVFDTSSGVLLYFSDQSIDITPLVKKELGITK